MMASEFKRLLSRPMAKALLIFIVISFLLGGLYIPRSTEYDQVYDEYGVDRAKFFQDNENGLLNYNEGSSYFYDQAKYIQDLPEEINDKINGIENKLSTSLFSSPSDQRKLNKEKTFYKSLSEEDIDMHPIYQVDRVLRDRSFYYLLPVLSTILIILIFGEDIEKETLSLFKTTRNSLSRLFWAKSLLYIKLMAAMVLLLAFMTSLRTGFSTLPLHSIPYFKNTMGTYSVLGFILKESLHIFINSLVAGYALLILLLIFKNQAMAFVGIISLYFVQALLYLFISPNSYLVYLKYFNIFYLTFINRLEFMLINNYLNLFIGTILLVLFMTTYFFYRSHKQWNTSINKGIPLRTTNFTFHSIYQLLISYGGILMILVILLFSLYNIQSFSFSIKSYEKSYQIFKSDYLGPIDSDLQERIIEDKERISQAYEESIILKDYIDSNPEKANEIYFENDHIFTTAKNYENINRLVGELEEAQFLGVYALVDTRGTDLLFMKINLFSVSKMH